MIRVRGFRQSWFGVEGVKGLRFIASRPLALDSGMTFSVQGFGLQVQGSGLKV